MENYKETFKYGVDARSTYVTISNSDYNYKFKITDVEEGVVMTVKMYEGDDEIELSESDGYYVYSSTGGEYCETKEYIIKVTVDDELVQKINVTQVNIHQQTQGGGSVEVPTKLSQLTNDVGYITNEEVPTQLSDFNNDVGYVTQDEVPPRVTMVSELENDSMYISSGENVSVLENDVSYQTENEVQALIGSAVTDVLDEEF